MGGTYSTSGVILGQLLPSVSYMKPGYLARSFFFRKSDVERDLNGQVHLITGANSGIGKSTAESLARNGATIHMVCRNRERGEEARNEIVEKTGNKRVHLHVVDLSVMSEVKSFASSFKQQEQRLDVLVNNAGFLPVKREVTSEGIEKTFATNVLSNFVLMHSLEPLLRKSAPARVINVTSAGMYTVKLDVDDLQSEKEPFDGAKTYAQTKRAQVELTDRFAERWAGTGVTCNSMHPGWVKTNALDSLFTLYPAYKTLLPAWRDPNEGADTVVFLATSPHVADVTGQFFFDRTRMPKHCWFSGTQSSKQDVDRLWSECLSLSGMANSDSGSDPDSVQQKPAPAS